MFAFVITALSAIPALAQPSDVTWGVQGGGGIGYGTVTEGTTREMKPAYNVGVFAVTPFIGGFKFQPEVKWDHRDITIGGIATKVDYLSVPLLLRTNFLGIFMTQGVALNFVERATVFDVDFKSALTSPDMAIILGVGKRVGNVAVSGRWDSALRSFQGGINAGGVHARAITGVVSVFLR
jgi:hypothetical protein